MKTIFSTLSVIALLFGAGYGEEHAVAKPTKISTNPTVAKPTKISANQLSERMREAYKVQITREQYSANLYLTFASYFADVGLDGCEQFFRHSSEEEFEHALIFFNHLIDRNEKFSMGQVDASALMPTSPLDAFTKLYENEMEVTRSIHNLYRIAIEENDYASQAFLHPFLLLQVEEEKQAQDLLVLISSGADNPAFVLVFDEKVAELTEED